MKYMILFFVCCLYDTSILFCPIKRGNRPLAIQVRPDAVEESLEFDELDTACKRSASREFVNINNLVIALGMPKKVEAEAFEEICCKVHAYKALYFRILAGNQLLCDGEIDGNPFHVDLLAGLHEVAKKHSLRSELIPRPFPCRLITDGPSAVSVDKK